jgi:hypothetical protein
MFGIKFRKCYENLRHVYKKSFSEVLRGYFLSFFTVPFQVLKKYSLSFLRDENFFSFKYGSEWGIKKFAFLY